MARTKPELNSWTHDVSVREDGSVSLKRSLPNMGVFIHLEITDREVQAIVDARAEAHHAEAPWSGDELAVVETICPECRQGKHGNCDGRAFNAKTDNIVDCTCPTEGHA